jgi:hypothetical protein
MSDPRHWNSRASEAIVIVASILLAFWLLLDEKEARRPASSPQLLPATRSRRLLHLLCETALTYSGRLRSLLHR